MKAFSRPAAGQPPPLPSDVRPPQVLVSTLKYLINEVIPQLPRSHPFLWDRTRSIRQDFTYQNYSGPEAIECNELIARIHLLSLHIMLTSDQEYSKQQELEQLNKTLQTLSELYDSNRKNNTNVSSPREAEFRSYILLSHINDPDIDRQTQLLPQHIYDDPKVQNSIKLRGMMQMSFGAVKKNAKENSQNLFTALFQSLGNKNISFLAACLVESHFQDIRFGALGAMAKSYHSKGKPYSLTRLSRLLGFNNDEDTASFCTSYGMTIVQDEQNLAVSVTPARLNAATPFSNFFSSLVDVKKGSKSWSNCILDDDMTSASGFSNPATNISAAKTFQSPASASKSTPSSKTASSAFGNNTFLSNTSSTSVQASASSFSFGTQPTATTPNTNAFNLPAANTSNSLFGTAKSNAQPAVIPPVSVAPVNTSSTLFSGLAQPVSTPKDSPLPNFKAPDKAEPSRKPPTPVAPPPPPQVKIVVKHVYSEGEVQMESARITKEVVSKALSQILPNAWTKIQEKRQIEERKRQLEKVRAMAVEHEFQRMVQQLLLEQAKMSKAIQMDNSRLAKLAVRLVGRAAFISKDIADQLARQKNEYKMISQQLGRPRALGSSTVVRAPSFNKKQSTSTAIERYELKMGELKQQKELSESFWRPLNIVESVANPLESGLRKSHVYGYAQLGISCFCRNWDTVVGQWLKTKLRLSNAFTSSSKSTEVWIDQLQEDPQTYHNLCQLILVTGVDHEGQPEPNLEYSKEVFQAIMARVDGNTSYKLDLLLIHWGGDDNSESTVLDQLSVSDYKSQINSVVFCAMGGYVADPSTFLKQHVEKLASNFEGTLSAKGKRDRQEAIQQQNEERERHLYEAYLKKVKEDEAERNRRLGQIQKMNSLHFFSPAQKNTPVLGDSEYSSLKSNHKRDWEGQQKDDKAVLLQDEKKTSVGAVGSMDVPKGVRELKELIASVTNKRPKTAT